MKKLMLTSTALLCTILLFAGCTSTNDNANAGTDNLAEPIPTEDNQSDDGDSSESPDAANSTAAYTVTITSYEKTDLHDIQYPVFSAMENTAAQDKLNAIFLERTETMAEFYTNEDEYYTQYRIATQEPEFLSLVCDGHMYYVGSAHPSAYCHSTNINMTTGEFIMLKDFADIDTVANALLDGTNITLIGVDDVTIQDVLAYNANGNEVTLELLKNSLAHFDEEYNADTYDTSLIHGYSYMENGKVCLIFEMQHAVGDYIIVQIN